MTHPIIGIGMRFRNFVLISLKRKINFRTKYLCTIICLVTIKQLHVLHSKINVIYIRNNAIIAKNVNLSIYRHFVLNIGLLDIVRCQLSPLPITDYRHSEA